MAIQVQVRGAATGTQSARTLVSRELDIDTTLNRLNVHNGSTAGGIPHANYVDIQNQRFTTATATGTNAIAITVSPAPSAYATLQSFEFKAANTTTGAATLNVNSLGAKNIYKQDTATGTLIATEAGDIIAGGIYKVTYDGTQFQVSGGIGSAAGGFEFLSSQNTTSGTAISFDVPDGYSSIHFVLQGVSFNATQMLYIRTKAFGLSYGADMYGKSISHTFSSSTLTHTDTNLASQVSIIQGFATDLISGSVTFNGCDGTQNYKSFNGDLVASNSGGAFFRGSVNTAANRLGGVQFYSTSAAFDAGKIYMYGIKSS